MKIRAVKTRVSPCRETDKRSDRTDTEMTKLTVVFRNFAHAPKKYLMRISWLVPFFSFLLLFFFFLFFFFFK